MYFRKKRWKIRKMKRGKRENVKRTAKLILPTSFLISEVTGVSAISQEGQT